MKALIFIDPSPEHPGVWLGPEKPDVSDFMHYDHQLKRYQNAMLDWLSSLVRAKEVRLVTTVEMDIEKRNWYFKNNLLRQDQPVEHTDGVITEIYNSQKH